MIRTQIQLTEQQAERLRAVAAARGVSLAKLIREALEVHLSSVSPADRRRMAAASIGGFRSGLGDVSENHDDHLAGAYSD